MTPNRRLPIIILAGLGMALTACNAPTPVSPPAASGAAADGPAVPKVNRLVMAIDPVPVESNELRLNSSPSVFIFRSIYEYPVAMDIKTGKFAPGLATEWSLEPDGASYRVKLRRGVQFHDGWGEFTGKDLAYMWKDITSPESTHGQTTYWRTAVKDVEVPSDYEVVYRLTKPDGQFVAALSESQGGAEVRSKAQVDAKGPPSTYDKGAHAGTGWYQYVERVQGVSLRMKRIDYRHWGGVTPDFPEFEFRFVKEPSTRLAALLAGEAHLAALPSDLMVEAQNRQMALYKGIFPGIRIFGTMHCCFLNNAADPSQGWKYPQSPLMDVRVRRALNKAVNKDAMNKAFFGGKGEPMYVNHFHPSRDGWNPEWEKRYAADYGYDLEAAKQLLADAGYNAANPLKTTIYVVPVAGVSGGPDIAEAIATNWKAAGVQVDLTPIEGGDLTAKTRQSALSNSMALAGTGSNQWTGMTVYNSSFSPSGVQDPAVEATLQELTRTLDESKRDGLWRKVGDAMFAAVPGLSLFWLPAEAVGNPKIIASWAYPGALTGTWTHIHNIKAAR